MNSLFHQILVLVLALPLPAIATQTQVDRYPSNPDPVADVEGRAEAMGSATGESVKRRFEFEKRGGILYRSGEGYRLTLDVYVPAGAGPYPALLAVHGGAWRSGTKLNWFRHARKLARAGFVVVAINYRHAPQFPFPAQIHDCKAAVRWMRIHAEPYKIDPACIGGLGYSAGGHLVALLGTSDPQDGLEGEVPEAERHVSSRLQAVAAGGAVCEFSWVDEDSRGLVYWLQGSRSSRPEAFSKASPTTYITADDPPFYFFHGSQDWVVPDRSPKIMHEKLLRQSLPSRLDIYEGYGHFGLFSHLQAMDPVIEFFQHTLRRQPVP